MSANHTIGAMNKLADALDNAGFSASDVTKLTQYSELDLILQLLNGYAQIVQFEYIIDCDADPLISDGWRVVEHCKNGQMKWDPENISLYLSKEQHNDKGVVGHELYEKLKKKKRLNANVLDFLFANPLLIPEKWKNKFIFFWGTIYLFSDGHRYVRRLYCFGGVKWTWDYCWLDRAFDGNCPAALSAD